MPTSHEPMVMKEEEQGSIALGRLLVRKRFQLVIQDRLELYGKMSLYHRICTQFYNVMFLPLQKYFQFPYVYGMYMSYFLGMIALTSWILTILLLNFRCRVIVMQPIYRVQVFKSNWGNSRHYNLVANHSMTFISTRHFALISIKCSSKSHIWFCKLGSFSIALKSKVIL